MSVEDRPELRLALAMRGGVSLAVWIGGACSEIDHLRRSQLDDGSFWGCVLRHTPYRNVKVDVLAGASAGGLNGVIYAASQVYGFPLSEMRGIWLELGGTEGLVRTEKPWPSLFKGDEYFLEKVHDHLKALAEHSPEDRPPPTPVDLRLSATVIEPVVRPAPSPSDETLHDRRYASGFHFRHPTEGWLDSDFPATTDSNFDNAIWRLALAGRATSSYPVAFEAASVHSTRAPSFTGEPRPVGGRFNVDARGVFLDRTGDQPQEAFLVADGGIMDNIPIGRALDTIAAAPAEGPTARKVIYLQPGAPSRTETEASGSIEVRRATPSVLRGAVRTRVSGETINADIAQLEDYNERIARAIALRRGIFAKIGSSDGLRPAAEEAFESYRLSRAQEDARLISLLLSDPIGFLGEDPFPATLSGQPIPDDRWRSPTAKWDESDREKLSFRLAQAFAHRLPGAPAPQLETVFTTGTRPIIRVTQLLLEWTRFLETRSNPKASHAKAKLYRIHSFLRDTLEQPRRLAWVAATAVVDKTACKRFASVAAEEIDRLCTVGADDAAAIIRALRDGGDKPLRRARHTALVSIDDVADRAKTRAETEPPPAFEAPDGTDLRTSIAALLVEITQTVIDQQAEASAAPTSDPTSPTPTSAATPDEREQRMTAGEAAAACLERALSGPVTTTTLAALEVVCFPEFVAGLPGRRRIDFVRLSSANRTPLASKFGALLRAAAQEPPRWWDPENTDPDEQKGIHVDLKLAGNELANFSAFLLADWRANDWMWGRLDAVPTLVDTLITPKALRAALDDSPDAIRQMIAPDSDPWADDVWDDYGDDVAQQVNALMAATTDEVPSIRISAIRNALIARRQWEILHEELALPNHPMGSPPNGATSGQDIAEKVAAYRVGAETLRENEHAPELIDRLSEIATAATESVFWNLEPAHNPPIKVPTAVSSRIRAVLLWLGPKLARRLVQPPKTKVPSHIRKAAWAVGFALVAVLFVLGYAINGPAFLIGLSIGLSAVVPLGVIAYRRLKKILLRPAEPAPS